MTASHKFTLSPRNVEKITRFPLLSRASGCGWGPGCAVLKRIPTLFNASAAPDFTALPPVAGTDHQSAVAPMDPVGSGFPKNSRRLASDDQTGNTAQGTPVSSSFGVPPVADTR